MATLQFKGKSAVWNHHLSVPYHTLEKDAKKSLLPAPRHATYVIRCENDSFYIGQTDNLLKRWKAHKEGKVSWTNRHKPVEVIHHEEFETRDEAVKREKELKTGFGRKWLKREYKKSNLNRWNEDAARQAGKGTDADLPVRGLLARGAQASTQTGENLIIEGDNLLALKSLLPKYQGRIKCIYIDPPYNTGNENWVYSDNVNSPTIQEWVGKVVGKQGEDLTRHDKWLCMMTPRLKLLRELLADDGAIFISIDDNEQHHLRNIMDGIFGEENFVTNIIWQKKYSPQNDAKYFSDMHDFILVYAKNKINGQKSSGWVRNLLPRTDEMNERYDNPDNDPRGLWKSSDLSVKTYSKEYDYPITTPSGRKVNPPQGRCWRTSKENLKKLIRDNRVWFGPKGDGVPSVKRFLSEVQQGMVPVTIWFREEVGDNQEARQELKELFPDVEFPFETPKPTRLIKRILQLATDKDSVVLDSFAGSATTAHATLDLNKEDGGNRRFVLVEMEDYANDITAERVRRVIRKSKYKTGFSYYTLGSAIDAESILTGKLPTYKEFAKYVYYLATGKNHPDEKKIKEDDSFVGKTDHQSVYLLYEKNADVLKKLAITLDWAQKTHKKDSNKKIVYAPACYLDDEALEQFNIKFVSIPYNLFERTT